MDQPSGSKIRDLEKETDTTKILITSKKADKYARHVVGSRTELRSGNPVKYCNSLLTLSKKIEKKESPENRAVAENYDVYDADESSSDSSNDDVVDDEDRHAVASVQEFIPKPSLKRFFNRRKTVGQWLFLSSVSFENAKKYFSQKINNNIGLNFLRSRIEQGRDSFTDKATDTNPDKNDIKKSQDLYQVKKELKKTEMENKLAVVSFEKKIQYEIENVDYDDTSQEPLLPERNPEEY